MGRGTVELVDRDREVRKHLWGGLARLGPGGRLAFLRAMCGLVCRDGVETRVTEAPGSLREAFLDLCLLSACYGLDLNEACAEMERWLRGKRGDRGCR